MDNLPDGWTRVKFGHVVRQSKEKVDAETSDLERYVAGEHMDTDDLRIRRWGIVGDGYLGPAFHRRFVKGQVLYGSRRTYLRKVAYADFDGICANTTFVLETKDANVLIPELLPFIMQSESFTEHSVTHSRGSVNPYVNFKDIAWYEFALPPLDEQHRIAEILWAAEEAISRLQVVVNTQDAAKRRLAYELLTQGIGNSRFKKTEIGEIPESWRVVRISDLVRDEPHSLLAGPFGTIFKAKDFRDEGVPIVQLRHITERGFDWGDDLTFMSQEVYERLHKPYTVHSGDLLVTKLGEPPGLACLYPKDAPYGMVTPDVIKCSLNPDFVDQRFAVYMYNNAATRKRVGRLIKGGTRPRLTLDDFYALPLPLPELDEQLQIVDILGRLDDGIKQEEAHIRRLQALSRSIRETVLSGLL